MKGVERQGDSGMKRGRLTTKMREGIGGEEKENSGKTSQNQSRKIREGLGKKGRIEKDQILHLHLHHHHQHRKLRPARIEIIVRELHMFHKQLSRREITDNLIHRPSVRDKDSTNFQT